MRSISLILLALALCSGCAHSVRRAPSAGMLDGAPSVRDLRADLEGQQASLARFEVAGRLVVKLPEDAAAYSFRNTRVSFEAPDRLHVDARKHGARAFLLTATGEGFVVVSPAKKTYLHETGGAWRLGEDAPVSPADLARELLLGEDWAHLSPRRMKVTGIDRTLGEVTLEVYEATGDSRLVRRVLLRGGPPWQEVFDQRYDPATGRTLAETTRGEFVSVSGTVFPQRIETHLPGHDAWMRLEVEARNLDTGVTFAPEVFDVESALRDARRRGYERLEMSE